MPDNTVLTPARVNAELSSTRPSSYRWVITTILFVVVTVAFLDKLNISVLIIDEHFVRDMGIKGNALKMGMLMSGFLIPYGFANICLASLGDLLGPRRMLAMALVLWSFAMAVGGLAGSFAILLASRAMLGVGEGFHWPIQAKYCKNWFPPSELGRANSIWVVGAKVGPAIAVPLFSFIIVHFGWRASFFFLGTSSIVLLAIIWLMTTDYPEQCRWVNRAEIEYIRDNKELKQQGNQREKIAAIKRDFKQLVHNTNFWVLVVSYCCQCGIFWGMLTWLPSYLKIARGFSWTLLGSFTALTWVLSALMAILVGYITDKLGRRAPFLIVGFVGAATGISISAVLQNNVHAAWAITLGVGLTGCSMAAHWILATQLVPTQAVSSGCGIMNGAGTIFSAFIPALVGYCINLTRGYTGGLMALVGIALLGIVCGLILTIRKQ